jgi:hypothetical protein
MPACEPEAARLGGSGWGWGGGSFKFVALAHPPALAAHRDRDLDPAGTRGAAESGTWPASSILVQTENHPTSARPLVILSMPADPF